MPERIERWMMEEVKGQLERKFVESAVDYFPRGNGTAVLFRVEATLRGQRKLLHQLWIDRSFFLRCADRAALRHALEGADVVTSMKKAGDKIVELH